jgi:CheY-like chemotaxis protein
MSDKNTIISKVYYDKSGYGSIKNTLDDARKTDKSININDVKQFFYTNVEKKTNLQGGTKRCNFDLIFLDLHMPVLDGF